ncbi:MAG: ribose 5-phosphate isomerase B [Candidatus Delongbacteria bacterium]|nr:ribose 5-phosphate isomerase B [Candidatus Delongbacteria bacterium]
MRISRVHMACDHGGFALKEHLKSFLTGNNVTVDDLGAYSEDPVNYPDYGKKAAEAVLNDGDPAIIICGTGIGISIAANRFRGIRAALCHCVEYAELSRKHNNANILALGGRFITENEAENIVTAFLETEFEGGRHKNRIDLIDDGLNN